MKYLGDYVRANEYIDGLDAFYKRVAIRTLEEVKELYDTLSHVDYIVITVNHRDCIAIVMDDIDGIEIYDCVMPIDLNLRWKKIAHKYELIAVKV